MDLLSRLFIFSPTEKNKKFTNVFIRNISELAALKLVMSVTKETSQVSLCGNSFTDVGYNIGQVEMLLSYINRYYCVF